MSMPIYNTWCLGFLEALTVAVSAPDVALVSVAVLLVHS